MNVLSLIIMTAILSITILAVGCSSTPEAVKKSAFVMDTVATITIYDDPALANAALELAFDTLNKFELLCSYTDPESTLSKLNASTTEVPITEFPKFFTDLVVEGLRFSEITDGRFDISLGSLIELWSNNSVPEQKKIDELLPHLGYTNIKYESRDGIGSIGFADEKVKMHFGALAKGVAIDYILDILEDCGFNSAIVEIGGEVGVLGKSQSKDGYWKIGVRDPFNNGETIETIAVKQGLIATSGVYERFFIENGNEYHHILDPKTGYPADSGLVSVTVISDSGAASEALSTAFLVAGGIPEDFMWEGEYCVVFINKNGEITYSHFSDCDFCAGNSSVDYTLLAHKQEVQ